jgi:hypothetical protein
MPDALATLGFSSLLVVATLAAAQLGDVPAGLVTAFALAWGWWTRGRFPGQGVATAVAAVGTVLLGLAAVLGAAGAAPTEVGSAALGNVNAAAALGLSGLDPALADRLALGCSVVGTVDLMAACARLARARGRSAWWGILGVTNILGFGILLWLPVPPPEFRV